ncbi:MAG: hypothetical protein ACLFRY_05440 [Spirochaetia bacterium]
MKREDRLLKNYFKERVRHVSRRTPPIATAAPEPRNRIFGALAYAAILAAAVLPFSEALRENPLARTVTAVYRAHGMETRAEEGIERFFLTLKSHLEEEKNL